MVLCDRSHQLLNTFLNWDNEKVAKQIYTVFRNQTFRLSNGVTFDIVDCVYNTIVNGTGVKAIARISSRWFIFWS